jgi:hypothetical protein
MIQEGKLTGITLKNGILRDSAGRIGSVVDNFQFQFDGPPQASDSTVRSDANASQDKAIYTAGFSMCKNFTLALGRSTFFNECNAGANFWNYYFFVGLDTSEKGRPLECRGVNLVNMPPGGFAGATTVNTVVVVTETAGLPTGHGTATGTGAFGGATGTGKDASGRGGTATRATGTGTGTAATGTGSLETGARATGKEARPGIGSNSTASLTALSPDLPTTTPASNLTTTSSEEPKTPPPGPATPSASAPGGKASSGAAGLLEGGRGHAVALMVGLVGVALL